MLVTLSCVPGPSSVCAISSSNMVFSFDCFDRASLWSERMSCLVFWIINCD